LEILQEAQSPFVLPFRFLYSADPVSRLLSSTPEPSVGSHGGLLCRVDSVHLLGRREIRVVAMQELWEVISGIVSIPPPALCSLRLAPLILLCPTIGTRTDTHFDGFGVKSSNVYQALRLEVGFREKLQTLERVG